MPGGAGRESVTLNQDDVGPAGVGEVVGHGGADDSATDDDDARPVGQLNSHPDTVAADNRGQCSGTVRLITQLPWPFGRS